MCVSSMWLLHSHRVSPSLFPLTWFIWPMLPGQAPLTSSCLNDPVEMCLYPAFKGRCPWFSLSVHWSTSKSCSQINVPLPDSGDTILNRHFFCLDEETILAGCLVFLESLLLFFPHWERGGQYPNQNLELIPQLRTLLWLLVETEPSLSYY